MNTHAMTLRLDEETWEQVRDYAHANRISISDFIREAVNEKLDQIEQEKGRLAGYLDVIEHGAFT